MKILLMHQTIAEHDAIGNDIEAMFKILSRKYECFVFADYRQLNGLSYIDEKDLDTILAESGNLVIYHHSVFWKTGETLLLRAKCRIVIRYHNITPPAYFKPYNDFHTQQCARGREQTTRFSSELPDAFWLCDSHYNSMDVTGVETRNMGICPPFHKIETWAQGQPDEQILKALLYSTKINLLFVGRIAPNKGHLLLLDILHTFCMNYEQEICLWVIGKFDEGLAEYNRQIHGRAERYGLRENVRFVGEITDATLMAYYLGCDIFVCASEHEGFGVPLIEAQYFKLPVIALNSSAVPETLGSEQIVLGSDPKLYAAAIHTLHRNNDYLVWLREKGRQNFDHRFRCAEMESRFLKQLETWSLLI